MRQSIAVAAFMLTAALVQAAVAQPNGVVTVVVNAPGTHATTLDNGVALPLTEALLAVPGIKTVEAQSSDGACMLIASFAAATDQTTASARVADALRAAQAKLISRTGPPQITNGDPRELATYCLSLQSDTLPLGELSGLARRVVQEPLAMTRGVGRVGIIGAVEPEPTLWLDAAKMTAAGITPRELAQAVEKQADRALAADIGQIVIATANGAPLRVSDVARLDLAASSQLGRSSMDGRPAILIALTPTVAGLPAEELRRVVAAIAARLPNGVQLTIAIDLSKRPEFPRTLLIDLSLLSGASPQQVDHTLDRAVAVLRRTPPQPLVLAFPKDAVTSSPRLLVQPPPGAATEPPALSRALAADLPDASPRIVELTPSDRNGRAPIPFPIRIALTGPDPAANAAWARATAATLASVDSVTAVGIEPAGATVDEPQLSIEIDQNRTASLGIDQRDVADAITQAKGQPTRVKAPGGTTLALRRSERGAEALATVHLRSKSAQWVPLASIAAARQSVEPSVVYRLNRSRGLLLTAAKARGIQISKAISQCVDAANMAHRASGLPDDYRVVVLTDE
jgi:multidrug efflux pump subunit AcrB